MANNKPGAKKTTALITGASSGIGAEFARQLAARGMNLVLVARREERLAALRDELEQKHGIRAEVLVADLLVAKDIEQVERRIAELTDLEILVNNAGFGVLGNFCEVDIQGQLDMIGIHILATVRLARAAVAGMIARKRGFIINLSSVAAFLVDGEYTTYCAVKAYVNSFSESLQHELRGTGVKVQALCPGLTSTEFHSTETFADFDKSQIPKWMWGSAERVVAKSLKALRGKRVIVVPGVINAIIARSLRRPLTRPLALALARSTK